MYDFIIIVYLIVQCKVLEKKRRNSSPPLSFAIACVVFAQSAFAYGMLVYALITFPVSGKWENENGKYSQGDSIERELKKTLYVFLFRSNWTLRLKCIK